MGIHITGVGSYIPSHKERNQDFLAHTFLDDSGNPFGAENDDIIEKFKAITGIEERRYAKPHQTASDLAFLAAEKAIEDASLDPETLDYIIVAHNFGDIQHGCIQTDMLPSLATRVKHNLQIKNPNCVAYDLIFGCPGWVEGVIQAQAFIKSGMAKRCMVIGADTLSRIADQNDRDAMIFADGAGATIIEETEEAGGLLSHCSQTYSTEEAFYLFSGKSNDPTAKPEDKYIKMLGRKVYEFAICHVPQAMKDCFDKSGEDLGSLKKIFLHQANEKMDEAIVKRFYRLFREPVPADVLPISIHKLGNSSVATVPTLLDLVKRNALNGHQINKGDVALFASVGAGMNINAFSYSF
jgi:3-oxoacyl-[acyl-carrier-protein] synthase-3